MVAEDESRIARRSLAEEVADRLRSDILSGRFLPGKRLVSQTLEERYGVSHIPIREALRSLEAERLVLSRRGVGAIVAETGEEDLHDLYDMRKVIEAHVLRRAVDRYDDEALARMEHALDSLAHATPGSDDGWWVEHRDFHSSLLEPGLTPWSERLLHTIWNSVERYQRLYVLVYGSVEVANREHGQLLEAARERDADRLVDLWIAHLEEKEASVAAGLLEAQQDAEAAG